MSMRIPAHLEPSGVCKSDGKRLDGTALIPWSRGRVLVWDVICPDTFAPSGSLAAKGAGLIATQAEERKRSKFYYVITVYSFGNHFSSVNIVVTL